MNKEDVKAMNAEEAHKLLADTAQAGKWLVDAHYHLRLEIACRLVREYPITLGRAIQEYSNQPMSANKDAADMKLAYAEVDLLGNYLRKKKAEQEAAAAAAKLLADTPKQAARSRRKSKKVICFRNPATAALHTNASA